MRLYEYCKTKGLLTWGNSVYKAYDSTINQLIYLTLNIYQALENTHDICFVSHDASAAFDSVWHDGIILKPKQFGIKGILHTARAY